MKQADLFPQERPKAKHQKVPTSELLPEVVAPSWMVEDVEKFGIVEPVVLADNGDEGYEVVEGRKRIACAHQLGIESIDAMVYDYDEIKKYIPRLTVSLNEKRTQNHVTNFDGVESLSKGGRTDEEIGRETGLNVQTVRAYLSLFKLHPGLRAMFRLGSITFAVARKIASLPMEDQNLIAARDERITAKLVKTIAKSTEQEKEVRQQRLLTPVEEWHLEVGHQVAKLLADKPEGAPLYVPSFLESIQAHLGGR